MVDVILPAGGRIGGDFAAEAGASIKALIELHGVTVLERTVRVLRAMPEVGRIVVIGPAELQGHAASRGADVVLPEGDSGPSNIMLGLEWLGKANARSRARLDHHHRSSLPEHHGDYRVSHGLRARSRYLRSAGAAGGVRVSVPRLQHDLRALARRRVDDGVRLPRESAGAAGESASLGPRLSRAEEPTSDGATPGAIIHSALPDETTGGGERRSQVYGHHGMLRQGPFGEPARAGLRH